MEPPLVPSDKRQELIGQGWQQSGDRLWTTSGDSTGFHLLVAEAKTGYSWRTVATLGNKAVDTDKWIGNACLTGSGDKAVVVYAPRTFTNKEQLFSRGGFTAIVELSTGKVREVPVRTSLAYFNPGCGVGETAALTQGGEEDLGKTALLTVDTTSGALSGRTELEGQLTSAVPYADGFAVAGGSGVLKVGRNGKKERMALTADTPSYLRPDADGGVVYLARQGDNLTVQRTTGIGRTAKTLASSKPGEIGVASGTNGKVFITGKAEKLDALPASVRKLDVPFDAAVSTTGETAITELLPSKGPMDAAPQAWHIKAKSLKTGRDLGFSVNAAEALKPREVEPGYTCAVPRNNPSIQVLQPKPKQVEWAVDRAVYGYLNVNRPEGWRGNGLAQGYSPQGLFPLAALQGGGHVPAQVMLGIIGQESNMWQAARHVLPGETGNPLIGNYYGQELYDTNTVNDWDIDFSKADCGYGVTQMTDGMRKAGSERLGETALDPVRQVAIATDYAANIAAGLRLLTGKWNELYSAGVKLHDGDPANIENWFFAAWSYNSGYNQPGKEGSNGAYGLGWGNNPANPRYDRARGSFGERPADFARPQFWPYPEKVVGFAANPPWGFEDENTEVPFFRPAQWDGGDGSVTTPGTGAWNRRNAKPAWDKFCTADNNCDRDGMYTPNAPEVDDDPATDTGPCAHKNTAGQYDLKCWWHNASGWKTDNCSASCGYQFIRYPDSDPEFRPEPPNGISFAPNCAGDGQTPAGLPSPGSALIIDYWTPTWRNCPALNSRGTVKFQTDGKPAGWVDLHQIGSGAGSHFWLTTTKAANSNDAKSSVRAEWQLDQRLRTKAKVLAYMPAHGGNKATRAIYKIETAEGVKEVEVNQTTVRNGWLDLGTFLFDNSPKVSLSSITPNGEVNQQMAFDAIAFNPVTTYVPPNADGTWKVGPLVNTRTGKCAYAPATGVVGTPVVQMPCVGNFSDHWIIKNSGVQNSPGTPGHNIQSWQFIHRATGLCVSQPYDELMQNGMALVLRTCTTKTKWLNSGALSTKSYTGIPLFSAPALWGMGIPQGNDADGAPLILSPLDVQNPNDPYAEWNV